MTATEAKRVLEETAPDAWLQIDPARFQKLIDSIPRRISPASNISHPVLQMC